MNDISVTMMISVTTGNVSFSGSMSRSLSKSAIYTRMWFISSILGQVETVVISPVNSIQTFNEHFTSVSILHLLLCTILIVHL